MAEIYTHTHTHTHTQLDTDMQKNTKYLVFLFLYFFLFSFPVYSVESSVQTIKYYFSLDSQTTQAGCPVINAPKGCEERAQDENGCPINVLKHNGENCGSQCCQRDTWTPYCVNNQCVQCRSNEDCTELNSRPLCNEIGFCEECPERPELPAGACFLNETQNELCVSYDPVYCSEAEICENANCLPCPIGMEPDETRTQCVCPEGYIKKENTCILDCGSDKEYNEQLQKCCPFFDSSLKPMNCRQQKTGADGCPYWEDNCQKCEIKTREQTWNFSTAAICSWMADHQVQNTCSSKGYLQTYSKCQHQYNPGYNQYSTHISYKECPYGFIDHISYPSLKNYTYTSTYQEQYADNCGSGQVCSDNVCQEKTACGADEIVVNGTCWKCPGTNQTANSAKTKCVCKTGYFLNENYSCVNCSISNSTSDGTKCICLPGYQAIYKKIEVSDGSSSSHIEQRLSACQACPTNAGSVNGSGCKCNPGFQPKYEKYQSCVGNVCSILQKLLSCSACPPNATSDGGTCSCQSGYVPTYTEYKSCVGNSSCAIYHQLKNCQPCSNSLPANATRGGSCNVITCNDGYYATAYQSYNYPNSTSYSSVISKCSPCPANSTGVGGQCVCNTGYKQVTKKIPNGLGSTRPILDKCIK